MGRRMVIGNIRDLRGAYGSSSGASGAVGRLNLGRAINGEGGLGLGQRVRELSATALDRGQARVKREIEAALPEPGVLEQELTPEQQEQLADGLDMALGALGKCRGPGSRATRTILSGLYEAAGFELAGPPGRSEVEGNDVGGADIIGLESSGLVRPTSDSEWR